MLQIGIMEFIRPLSAILFCLVARNISNLKIEKFKFVLWIAVIYAFVTVGVLISEVLGSAVLLLTISAMLYTNGNKFVSSIMTALFSMIIMVICNSASGLIMSNIYPDINYHAVIAESFNLYMLLLAFNYIFSLVISKMMGVVLFKKIKVRSFNKVNKSNIILFSSATLIVFLFIYSTALSKETFSNPSLLGLYIIFFIFLIIFTYYIFSSTMKDGELKTSEAERKQLEKYTANIEFMYNDVRSIRHDYANVLSSMIGYMDGDDMEGLQKYFQTKVVPFSNRMEIMDTSLVALSKIKELSLKGVVAVKLIKIQEDNIPLIVDINEDIEVKGIGILDLNTVVGILLDNAYEAGLECQEPYINVGFIKNGTTTTIVIVNSIKNSEISISKIFDQGYSTKGEDRGYGLNNVSKILEKYPNVILDTEIENKEFRQAIHIEEGDASNA